MTAGIVHKCTMITEEVWMRKDCQVSQSSAGCFAGLELHIDDFPLSSTAPEMQSDSGSYPCRGQMAVAVEHAYGVQPALLDADVSTVGCTSINWFNVMKD